MKITNPVLTGFHADPSMIRVKDTYYIANSTFEWFPGIRLHESKDMVHWNTLPYPLGAEQLDMRGDPASGGVWAPDLSYADGRFWIVYSDVHIVNGAFKDVVNYLTTAEDIRGPWSKPLRLNGVGFDASLFHDDDGRKYLVQQTWDHREYKHQFHGITLTEFDTATMRLKPETARTIWMGDDVKLVEGPHLYKINGWYYLFCAEGGTVWTHQESVARSRTLDELSFEASPTNPFITNFDIPGSYLQKQGHGALVDETVLHPVGFIATTAEGSLAAMHSQEPDALDNAIRWVRLLWDTPIRTGTRRYYDNFLYAFAFLALAGEYRVW